MVNKINAGIALLVEIGSQRKILEYHQFFIYKKKNKFGKITTEEVKMTLK
jgi:hypothetical protein